MILVEAAVETLADARHAVEEGAGRLELCGSLGVGGVTPAIDLLREVRQAVAVPIMVMIRPRGGDFLYKDAEIGEMLRAIGEVRDAGADGVVFGPLTRENHVDEPQLAALLRASAPMQTVFHRAIDATADLRQSIGVLADHQVTRVLTAGGGSSAESGIPALRALMEQFGKRIEILPGGGVRAGNARRIALETGVTQLHAGYPRGTPSGRVADIVRQVATLH